MPTVACTAIVTAFQRVDQTLAALERIRGSESAPAEILVHVDGNQTECEAAISRAFPDVQVLGSETRVGPGGARNKLIRAARNEIVASFDDDSFPIDSDYFARLIDLFDQFPEAAVVAAAIFHRGEPVPPASSECRWVATFVGCGCAYRRAVFVQTNGYVPLPLAYGMEEVDLSLRLHDMGHRILEATCLRVRHDTTCQHHENPDITAATIANIFLLTYLRYPLRQWSIGIGQVVNRVLWLVKHRRFKGIAAGFFRTPALLKAWAGQRCTVSADTLRTWRKLRRRPKLAGEMVYEDSAVDMIAPDGL